MKYSLNYLPLFSCLGFPVRFQIALMIFIMCMLSYVMRTDIIIYQLEMIKVKVSNASLPECKRLEQEFDDEERGYETTVAPKEEKQENTGWMEKVEQFI